MLPKQPTNPRETTALCHHESSRGLVKHHGVGGLLYNGEIRSQRTDRNCVKLLTHHPNPRGSAPQSPTQPRSSAQEQPATASLGAMRCQQPQSLLGFLTPQTPYTARDSVGEKRSEKNNVQTILEEKSNFFCICKLAGESFGVLEEFLLLLLILCTMSSMRQKAGNTLSALFGVCLKKKNEEIKCQRIYDQNALYLQSEDRRERPRTCLCT